MDGLVTKGLGMGLFKLLTTPKCLLFLLAFMVLGMETFGDI